MKHIRNNLSLLFIGATLLIFLLIFNKVFLLQLFYGGDYTALRQNQAEILIAHPFYSWQSAVNLGQSYVPFMNYAPYTALIHVVQMVVTQPDLLERLVWWGPYLVFGSLSIVWLYKELFPWSKFGLLAPLFFLCNSYALIIIGGGQISGIGLAYAFSPLVLLIYIRAFVRQRISFAAICLIALCLGIEGVFDVRFMYVSVIMIGFFTVIYGVFHKRLFSGKFLRVTVLSFFLPLLFVVFLHAYWLLPTVLFRQNPFESLGPGYTTIDAVKYFSFAHFENTIGLMHPTWPENVFGKTGFMQAEFLLLPILAFSSLFFLDKKGRVIQLNRTNFFVLFFALLSLLGAFLSKGANDPFGGIYLWLFVHVPGFVLFRDPTKWYVLIAISYAVLLPFMIDKLSHFISSAPYFKKEQHSVIAYMLVVSFVVCSFLFTIRPAFVGGVGGILQKKSFTTTDYMALASFLSLQKQYFRTLWIPSFQRFGYTAVSHPAVSAHDLLGSKNLDALLLTIGTKKSYEILQQSAIAYIIVPDDIMGELFVKDTVYSEAVYQRTIHQLTRVPWIHYVRNFGKITVFAINGTTDHFFYENVHAGPVEWRMITPAHYQISAEHGTIDGKLVFSEAYSPYWQVETKQGVFPSVRYHDRFNSFHLPAGITHADVVFIPQRAVTIGMWMSGITSVFLLGTCALLYRKRRYD